LTRIVFPSYSRVSLRVMTSGCWWVDQRGCVGDGIRSFMWGRRPRLSCTSSLYLCV